jgi:zinc transporter
MTDNDGLICAYRVAAEGSSSAIDWPELAQPESEGGWTWIHFDLASERARAWARTEGMLSSDLVETVFALETRPRCTAMKEGTLIILRGVNLNPQAEPEDMIAIRAWVERNRIITVRRRKLMAVDEIRQNFAQGIGPKTIGEFIIGLANGLVERMVGVLHEFEEEVDTLEEEQDTGDIRDVRTRLVAARQKIIPLRRYLAPQRDALAQLVILPVNWLDEWQRGRLREITDRVTRYVEDLDSLRERTVVIQDSVTSRIAERMNEIMMVLSIVAAIFLPLGLLTGLLGINVGGIPGTDSKAAFWLVTGLLVLLGIAELLLFRRLKWI